MTTQKRIKQAMSLPIAPDEKWVMERRPVNIEIEELGEKIQPHALACVQSGSGLALGVNIIGPDAPDSEVLAWAVECMLSPMVGEPRRPATIALTGGKLKPLQAVLEDLGMAVSASSFSDPEVSELVSAMESDMVKSGVPPYLMDAKDDPETVAEFFRAAADFYTSKPWSAFQYEVPIRLELQPARQGGLTYWAIVMGAAGQEYGLVLYQSSNDLAKLMDSDDQTDAMEVARGSWSLAFSYDDIDEIGPVAQAELMLQGWAIADDRAYPSAIVTDPKKKCLVRRATMKELVHLTTAVQAIAQFVRKHAKQIEEAEDVIVAMVQCEVLGKRRLVLVTCPAPEFLQSVLSFDADN